MLRICPERLDRLNPEAAPRRAEGREQAHNQHDDRDRQQERRRTRQAEADGDKRARR